MATQMDSRIGEQERDSGGALLPAPERSEGERSETERSAGAGSNAGGGAGAASQPPPDPEVSTRPVRRRFTAQYKLRILQEADRCSRGELGALLRREGLYSSHLNTWRRERRRGELQALTPKKRGPKAAPPDPVAEECKRLRRENERLRRRLQQAETIIDVQKKVSELLGIPLNSPESDASGS